MERDFTVKPEDIVEGLQESADGETVRLGDFTQYVWHSVHRDAFFTVVTRVLRWHSPVEVPTYEWDEGIVKERTDPVTGKPITNTECRLCNDDDYPCELVALVRRVCPPDLYEAALVAVALGGGE